MLKINHGHYLVIFFLFISCAPKGSSMQEPKNEKYNPDYVKIVNNEGLNLQYSSYSYYDKYDDQLKELPKPKLMVIPIFRGDKGNIEWGVLYNGLKEQDDFKNKDSFTHDRITENYCFFRKENETFYEMYHHMIQFYHDNMGVSLQPAKIFPEVDYPDKPTAVYWHINHNFKYQGKKGYLDISSNCMKDSNKKNVVEILEAKKSEKNIEEISTDLSKSPYICFSIEWGKHFFDE